MAGGPGWPEETAVVWVSGTGIVDAPLAYAVVFRALPPDQLFLFKLFLLFKLFSLQTISLQIISLQIIFLQIISLQNTHYRILRSIFYQVNYLFSVHIIYRDL